LVKVDDDEMSTACWLCSPKKTSGREFLESSSNLGLSKIAVFYLNPMLEQSQIDLETYLRFIKLRKNKINCIKQLRNVLLINHDDNDEIAALKTIFKDITIIFLKYFVPNWIYNSNITGKFAHLQYRLKMLRRVRNPLYFTYLQGHEGNNVIY